MKAQTIAIFSAPISDLPSWGPDNIKQGIAGSEEAVIYMSKELVKLGYDVVVFGDPPEYSPHSHFSANPRYISRNTEFSNFRFNIAISCRMPHIGETLRTIAKQVYLWPQDTLHMDLMEAQVNAFDDVFWISKWQREQWVLVNPLFAKFTGIYGNGINMSQFPSIQERRNPYSCIYGSNYSRGLEILLDIWPEVQTRFSKATLDIYYGWKHWGTLSPEKEIKMRSQIPALAEMGVIYHGLVGHKELNQAYAKASFWTYPCIASETFCITALRAQYSGCIPVIIDGSALGETVRFGYRCKAREDYLETLTHAMREAKQFTLKKREGMRGFISNQYTWSVLAKRYKNRFESLQNMVSKQHQINH